MCQIYMEIIQVWQIHIKTIQVCVKVGDFNGDNSGLWEKRGPSCGGCRRKSVMCIEDRRSSLDVSARSHMNGVLISL